VRAGTEEITLLLWGIHGEDVFSKVRMTYLRGMSGYLLVIDPTRRQTLEHALVLQARVQEALGAIPWILILDKCDLVSDWEIDPERINKPQSDGQTVIRTSAKTGEGVEEAFSHLAQAMLHSPC
jgi:GTPase SAR1 family protein